MNKMTNLKIGILLGLAFAFIDALLMIPIPMADKALAILGASINRFSIGLFIPLIAYPTKGWIRGIIVGLLLSLPDAIIAKSFIPIIAIGLVGGFICGLVTNKLVKEK